ncbi:TetR/AcrR family transcriptional regulator [Paenibacillus macerans]|uniref:TetR/AcrR family transcriptional regulator n=1 Tax=Paenibacillus macerans TaxID=44252 RepID=UPI003D3243FB
MENTTTRRRGEFLENDILQAAWDELTAVGYARLTMEGVAARAKTNKNAVYRRWPSKSKLVLAALRKHVPKPFDDVPDTGNLRDDLLMLLRKITGPLQAIGAETIHGLMAERLGNEFFASFPKKKKTGAKEKWTAAIMTILQNAEARGEVRVDGIRPRVALLPISLLQHEFLTSFEPVSDETVMEIIDELFLPLIRSSQSK